MKNDLEKVLKSNNLTKKQKEQAIKEYYEKYQEKIDKELNNYLMKQYTGAALEIGSTAIPTGSIGKIGSKLGQELLKKQLGRKISENIGAGILSGAAAGGTYGLGESLVKETNPLLSTLEGALGGAVSGGALGSIGSNIQKTIKGEQLKNYENIDDLTNILRKQYNNDTKKYYQDYIQGIQLNKDGNFDFTKRGLQEQLRWNPQQAQNFPELVNDIKNAKRLPDVPNTKPIEKPLVTHYEVYRGKNGDHYIEVMKDGSKRFYITKDTNIGTPHATSTGSNVGIDLPIDTPRATSTDAYRSSKTSLESPIDILNYYQQDYNTQMGNNEILYGHVEKNNFGNTTGQAAPVDINQLLNFDDINNQLEQLKNQISEQKSGLAGYTNPLTENNRIFTREDVDAMSNDEFSKYEKEIDAQTRAFNGTMPSNNDLLREAMTGGGVVYVNSYTRSDGTKVRGYYRSR